MYTEEGSLCAEVVDNVQLHQNSTAPLQNGSLQLCLGETTAKRELSSLGNPENWRGPKGLATFPQLVKVLLKRGLDYLAINGKVWAWMKFSTHIYLYGLVKDSWKSDAQKCQNQVTPFYDYPQKCLPQNCLPVGKSEVGIIIITHHQKCLP